MSYKYKDLIEKTVKRIQQLETQYGFADMEAETVVFYQLQAEKARLRLLLREVKQGGEAGMKIYGV